MSAEQEPTPGRRSLRRLPTKVAALSAGTFVAVAALIFTTNVETLRNYLLGTVRSESAASDWGDWVATTGSVVAVTLAIAVTYLNYRDSRRAAKPEVTYRDRISEVKAHLTRTSTLLRALEDDLTTRTELLEQAEADADRYEKLASLNADQAKAVEDLVGRQFKRQGRSAAIYWWASLVLAFLSGIVVNAITPTVLSWFP